MKSITRVLFVLIALFLLSVCSLAATSPEIFDDTAIRTEDPLGLRVKAVINAQTASDANTIEYGFLVSRKVLLSGNGLTNDDLTLASRVTFDKGVAKGTVNGESVDKFFDKNDTELYFAGHFYGISPKYYTDIIVARPYIISTDGVSYGKPVEMSIYGVAKDIYENKEAFDLLSAEQQEALISVIVAVEGEPYVADANDFRIVISTAVKKNANPTYSVYYDLYNPYTGEYLYGIKGRKSSKNFDEISSMLLRCGKIVPMYDGIIQDTTEGYVVGDIAELSPIWIGGYDGTMLTVSPYDASIKCKDCVKKHISDNASYILADAQTPVSVFDGNLESMEFSVSSMAKVMDNDVSLRGFHGELRADYIKAYVSSEKGICRYIIASVNDKENSALDEKCLEHTSFTARFYVDGVLYDTQNVLYNSFAAIPAPPEKDGYTFKGWSRTENGSLVNPEAIPVNEDTEYYAVFEKIIVYHDVTFIFDGEILAQYKVLSGEIAISPETPETEEGFKFMGWSALPDNDTDAIIDPSALAIRKETVFYSVIITNPNSDVFMEKLSRGYTQLLSIKRSTGLAKETLKLLTDCIGYVLEDANNFIYIDKVYVGLTYKETVEKAKKIVNEEMTSTEKSQFVNLVTKTVDKDVQDFLYEYFDINTTI